MLAEGGVGDSEGEKRVCFPTSGRAWRRRDRGAAIGGASGGARDDLADERWKDGGSVGELEGFTEHAGWKGEECGIFGEEGDEGLAGYDAVAETGVHLDTGVGADRVSGGEAAGAEALDGPAYLAAVHAREKARFGGGEGQARCGFVEGGGVLEDGGVAALGFDDL